MRWIVIQTKPNKENKATLNLLRQGYRVFFPKIMKHYNSFNTLKKRIKPLFPGYIFVNLKENQNWVKIKYTFGVKDIIKTGGEIYKLPNDIVKQIREKCDSEGICNFVSIKSGEKVKIINNKGSSLIGIFSEYIDEKRAFVFFELLKRKFKVKVLNNSIESLV